jgi:hypothetical protein
MLPACTGFAPALIRVHSNGHLDCAVPLGHAFGAHGQKEKCSGSEYDLQMICMLLRGQYLLFMHAGVVLLFENSFETDEKWSVAKRNVAL